MVVEASLHLDGGGIPSSPRVWTPELSKRLELFLHRRRLRTAEASPRLDGGGFPSSEKVWTSEVSIHLTASLLQRRL